MCWMIQKLLIFIGIQVTASGESQGCSAAELIFVVSTDDSTIHKELFLRPLTGDSQCKLL